MKLVNESNSGIFSNSLLGQYLESQFLPLPQPASVPDVPDVILPYVFIGDEGFPLCKDLMRPFPGENLPNHEAIFNYRLSRARRIIENTFGILAAKFRIFTCPLNADPDRVVAYTKATLALHNYLFEKESLVYCPSGFIDGEDGEGNTINGSCREHTIGDCRFLHYSLPGRHFLFCRNCRLWWQCCYSYYKHTHII